MKPRVWIIDDDRSIRWVLEKALTAEGFECDCFERGDGIITRLNRQVPDLIITDIRMPGLNGIHLLEQLRTQMPKIPVIIITAHSDLESAVSAYEKGAFEYLPKPFDVVEAVDVVKKALINSDQETQAQKPLEAPAPEPIKGFNIIGEAPALQAVFRTIGRLTQSTINAIIHGESGTGKELVAKALHQHSPLKDKPFLTLNMAAIPDNMVEVELFGSERINPGESGISIRQGRFEQANQGTLFLDEVGDIPLETQARLLRVISDGEFYRVGGQAAVSVNVRIIAATHQNLKAKVESGAFREDLYHRLNVIQIHLPKLSERKEDIGLLASHFLQMAANEMGLKPKFLSPDCLSYLESLDWPGNVRQLENTCRLITAMAPSQEIQLNDLPEELLKLEKSSTTEDSWIVPLKQWIDRELSRGQARIIDQATPLFEKAMIEIALKHTGGRKRDAADLLGWGRNTLTRKLKELSELDDA